MTIVDWKFFQAMSKVDSAKQLAETKLRVRIARENFFI